jgi:starvation-inducible outer membrane lipoprotein
MIPYSWFPRWPAGFTMVIGMTLFLWGCGNVPREYVRMAEPGTTLTALTLHPEMYQGKVVLLGGTIIQEEEHEQSLWLRVKNRPLDQDSGSEPEVPSPVSTVGADDGGRKSDGHAAFRD